MPTYTYRKCLCETNQEGIIERTVPVDDRNRQKCYFCHAVLTRKYAFTGSVYAPTAGGMR